MDILRIIAIILGIAGGAGIIFAGLGFGYSQFKTGASGVKDGLIKDYRDAIEIKDAKITQLTEEKNTLVVSHQGQLTELTGKIGKLEGLYEASEKEKKGYLEILQGRSPEQTKFMEYVTKSINNQGKIMEQLEIFMKNLNDNANILKEKATVVETRNKKIDSKIAAEFK